MADVTPTAPTPLATPVEAPVLATPVPAGRIHVVLIGAGGNGARIVPPLMQMLRRGDALAIVDDDIVEDRNLSRQHFSSRDIGQPKAAVLAARYNREGIESAAFTTRLTDANSHATITSIVGPRQRIHQIEALVVLGGVDNNASRFTIAKMLDVYTPLSNIARIAWIDIGNETRNGQVILSSTRWAMSSVIWGEQRTSTLANWTLPGMIVAMPQLLRPRPEEAAEATCCERIDLQTVNVNHLAAGAALNCLSWLMLGIPIGACGSFFSTLNTMTPIRLVGADFQRFVLQPDPTFALKEGE